jgi:L-ascorbate metabolism protein UlaG (beta-lactamase superfamily)
MKIFRITMISILVVLVLFVAAVYFFMQQAVFGKEPTGADLQRMEQSPNYKNGFFKNIEETETLLKTTSRGKLLMDFFNKPAATTPTDTIPSLRTNLKELAADQPTLVWFGHSSYLIKLKDYTILVDPVFSGNAAPISFFGKSFTGSDAYGVADMPPIDLLILTHDHYDHLDYKTIRELHPGVKQIITPLGVGSHLVSWNISREKITELDWNQNKKISDSITVSALPARHFSGRGFTQGKTLWASYVLQLNGYRLFLGGDSGYDGQFKKTGAAFGPFDLALLEAGQYGKDWPYIHMKPEETVQAALDLNTKVLLPVHWGKFALAYHPWNEPIERVATAAKEKQLTITTPLIGQPVIIGATLPQDAWWRALK